jgi:hypothetical protein
MSLAANRPTTFLKFSSIGLLLAGPAWAQQIDISGPTGSAWFGQAVAVLPNGNIVVTDPNGPVSNVGAVYVYSPTGTLISTLTGSSANDHVGSGGVTVLSNGNFVVMSPAWNNGLATNAGAATWGNATTGIAGVVSAANSLIGTSADDTVGLHVFPLSNGNYVVTSWNWNNGLATTAGAVTWGNGSTGVAGVVSASNSLVGTTAGDQIGVAIIALGNGNYVVSSPYWGGGSAANAGAATWGNGSTGISGVVSAANSLTGTTADDFVGATVIALNNGNYVVSSPYWDNASATDAGAVTWGNGNTGITGAVSASNSLIGATAYDSVGSTVAALTNGNYVVASTGWDDGETADVGAATWGNGSTGITGAVSAANSLIGATTADQVGTSVVALVNGNYVVGSDAWSDGVTASLGAATWGNGSTGTVGVVSAANSLIGTSANDAVGFRVSPLSNGNYVVCSPYWDNGSIADVGAVTWVDGGGTFAGAVSAFNSLIGTSAGDQVGSSGVISLSNGNYVAKSPNWGTGGNGYVGAATWGSGTAPSIGAVSVGNSLVGVAAGDAVGFGGVALSNGNYVVFSYAWDANTGAATWGNGKTGITGPVSAVNSLVGATAGAKVGWKGIALKNGDYVTSTPYVANGSGAVSLGRGHGGTVGPILSTNSVLGMVSGGGSQLVFGYDDARDTLVVGQPAANKISLFKSDLLFTVGFE